MKKINNFTVPERLLTLIENNQWHKDNFNDSFKILIPDYNFYFNVNGVESAKFYYDETFPQLYLDIEIRKALSLAKDSDKETLGNAIYYYFNIDKAITIGGSSADDALLLDYQFSNETPRVLISDFSGSIAKYICIAKDFDEFCEKFMIDF